MHISITHSVLIQKRIHKKVPLNRSIVLKSSRSRKRSNLLLSIYHIKYTQVSIMLLHIMNSVSYQQLQLEFLNMIRSLKKRWINKLKCSNIYIIVKTGFGSKYDMFIIWRQSRVWEKEITSLNLLYAIFFTTGHLGQFNPISYKIVVEDSENYSF